MYKLFWYNINHKWIGHRGTVISLYTDIYHPMFYCGFVHIPGLTLRWSASLVRRYKSGILLKSEDLLTKCL